MPRISAPKLKATALNMSKKILNAEKRVTINNVNMVKVRKTSNVAKETLQHIPDQAILKDTYNPGMVSTAAKRSKPKGIMIDVETNDIQGVNKVRQALKEFNVDTADNAVNKWSKIDSDIFLSRQMKR